MASADLAASIAVLLPGMGLAYAWFQRHERHFDHNRLLVVLMVGLVGGIALRFVEVYLFRFDAPRAFQPQGELATGTLVYSLAYTAVGYALLEAFAQTAVLGFRKFRTRPDTPFLGAALGLGFGTTWALQMLAALLVRTDDGRVVTTSAALASDAAALLLAYGLILAHAAAGAWIGHASTSGRLWKGSALGMAWLAPALGFYWLARVLDLRLLAAALALAWGGFAFWLADRRVVQMAVPPGERERERKLRRRERRVT